MDCFFSGMVEDTFLFFILGAPYGFPIPLPHILLQPAIIRIVGLIPAFRWCGFSWVCESKAQHDMNREMRMISVSW